MLPNHIAQVFLQTLNYADKTHGSAAAGDDEDGCGNNWNSKSCTAPVKSPSPTYTTANTWLFYKPDALPVTQPTASKQ